jgi:hypothetical protein
MAKPMSPVLRASRRIGGLSRLGTPEQVEQARRDLRELKFLELIATDPPMDDAEREHYAALLRPAS